MDMDDWQYEICVEFKNYSYVENPNAWVMDPDLIPDNEDAPSWWHNDTSGLQDW